jgi:hypothetical protein
MTRRLIVCILAATTSLAQAQEKAPKKQAPAPEAPATTQSTPAAPPSLLKRDEKPPELTPNQPVISIRGLCPADTKPATQRDVPSTKECAITVTKEQFDSLVKAFNANNQPVSLAARRKLGESYVDILVFSEAAKAAGVENSPVFAEVMRVLRLKTLADLYRNQLAEQYRNLPPQEIEAYYQANLAKYEGAKLSRVYLPKNSPDPQATSEQKQEYQKKVQQVLDDVQARAAKGEATDKLQKEAYVTLGISAAPPNTTMSVARHGMFPPKLDQEIFSHKTGEVFRSDDANGYLIYRLEDRQTSPLESVREEILREMLPQKFDEKTKELTAPVHTDYNEQYFGPPLPAAGPAGQRTPPNPPK